MAEVRVAVRAVATEVAAVAGQTVVPSVVPNARLALTAQDKTSRASDWTQTATLCRWQQQTRPRTAMARNPRASVALAVDRVIRIVQTAVASAVAVAATRSVGIAPPMNGVIALLPSAVRTDRSTLIKLHPPAKCVNHVSHVSHARLDVNRVSHAVSAALAGMAKTAMARQKACAKGL